MRHTILLVALTPLVFVVASCVGDDFAPAGGPDADGGNDSGGTTDTGAGGGNDSGGGTGDSGGGMDAGDADTPPADIDGDVIDTWGRPQAGATVRVGATKVTTDGTGHFHFALVPATYDLDVLAPSTGGGKGVTSFRAITTRTPRVNVDGTFDVRTTPVSGLVSNTAGALAANEHIRMSDMESAGGFVQPQISTDQTSAFNGTAVWVGPATQTLTYWVLRYTTAGTADQPITGFSQYFRGTHVETAGVADTGLSFPMIAATNAAVTGTVSGVPAAAGTADIVTSVKLTSDPFGYFAASKNGIPAGAFSVVTPSASGLVVDVAASASSSVGNVQESHKVWKANLATNATGIALSFGTAPAAMSPADTATGVTNGTAFSWTAGSPAGIYKVMIQCGSGATQYEATVFTTTTSAKFTDATALGAGWPSSASCTWGVTLYQKTTTVDAVMVANGRNKLDRYNGPVDGAFVEVRGYALTTL